MTFLEIKLEINVDALLFKHDCETMSIAFLIRLRSKMEYFRC